MIELERQNNDRRQQEVRSKRTAREEAERLAELLRDIPLSEGDDAAVWFCLSIAMEMVKHPRWQSVPRLRALAALLERGA